MTTYAENCTQSVEEKIANTLGSLIQRLQHWIKIQQLKINLRRERQQLLEMSDAMLGDLGITRAQAQAEARKFDMPGVRIGILNREVR
jgi:uncharacterized protein YjiS (DUF1127 family)